MMRILLLMGALQDGQGDPAAVRASHLWQTRACLQGRYSTVLTPDGEVHVVTCGVGKRSANTESLDTKKTPLFFIHQKEK